MSKQTFSGGGRQIWRPTALPVRAHRLVTWELDFNNTANWSSSGGALSYDTTYFTSTVASGGALSVHSITATKTNAGTTVCTLDRDLVATGGAKDFSTGPIFVRFYVHPGTGVSDYMRLKACNIFLAKNDWTAYKWWTIAGTETAAVGTVKSGWNELIFTPSTTQSGAPVGVLNMAAVERVRLRFVTAANADLPAVTWDRLGVMAPMAKAIYCMTFDDGVDAHYKMGCYLASKGLRATFYIVGSWLGQAGYMTLDQVRRLNDMGHLIANHSMTHLYPVQGDGIGTPFYLAGTQKQMIEEIDQNADFLIRNGMTRGALMFAYPGGYGNWREDMTGLNVIAAHAYQARSAASQGQQTLWNPQRPATSIFDSATGADTALTNALTEKTLCISGFHGPSGYALADWITHVDNVATQRDAGTIDVLTMDELLGKAA